MIFGKMVFRSVIGKYLLNLSGCLLLHRFLEAGSIYSSIIEAIEVQRLIMKVGSVNVCLLSSQFLHLPDL